MSATKPYVTLAAPSFVQPNSSLSNRIPYLRIHKTSHGIPTFNPPIVNMEDDEYPSEAEEARRLARLDEKNRTALSHYTQIKTALSTIHTSPSACSMIRTTNSSYMHSKQFSAASMVSASTSAFSSIRNTTTNTVNKVRRSHKKFFKRQNCWSSHSCTQTSVIL